MLTQENQILKLLADNNGKFETRDIPYDLAFEYRRALHTLRKKLRAEGQDIVARRITQNNWEYRLQRFGPGECAHFDTAGQGQLFEFNHHSSIFHPAVKQ